MVQATGYRPGMTQKVNLRTFWSSEMYLDVNNSRLGVKYR